MQVAELINMDWLNFPYTQIQNQKHLHRRTINNNHPLVDRASKYITDQLPAINNGIGTNFRIATGHFWIDEPGFSIDIHTDGELPNAMQMYWFAPGDEFGTGFYNSRNANDLLYQFFSTCNTGYIMLNSLNEDGSQPLLWHGMLKTVPENCYRLTSYCFLS